MKSAAFSAAVIEALVASARYERNKIKRVEGVTASDWYFARCVGKSDLASIDWLKRFDVPTYYPQVMDMKAVPRRKLSYAQRNSTIQIKRAQLTPLLPRYVMVQIAGVDQWRQVFNVSGLVGMAYDGGLPVRVPQFEINRMKAMESEGAIPATVSVRELFGIGEIVRVVDGPFASFSAVVEAIDDLKIGELDPGTRIKVAVDIFGRATPVELDRWQIEKL